MVQADKSDMNTPGWGHQSITGYFPSSAGTHCLRPSGAEASGIKCLAQGHLLDQPGIKLGTCRSKSLTPKH